MSFTHIGDIIPTVLNHFFPPKTLPQLKLNSIEVYETIPHLIYVLMTIENVYPASQIRYDALRSTESLFVAKGWKELSGILVLGGHYHIAQLLLIAHDIRTSQKQRTKATQLANQLIQQISVSWRTPVWDGYVHQIFTQRQISPKSIRQPK